MLEPSVRYRQYFVKCFPVVGMCDGCFAVVGTRDGWLPVVGAHDGCLPVVGMRQGCDGVCAWWWGGRGRSGG